MPLCQALRGLSYFKYSCSFVHMKAWPFLFMTLPILFCSCTKEKKQGDEHIAALTSFVNPFIGTGGHGHTYPGASLPFGMMQLSPDTRLDGWDGCSGYHYSDNKIYGFSHTHLSGTGVSDYGDILLMPTNKTNFNNGADGQDGYRNDFRHSNETASPGYYEVQLDSPQIQVRLSVNYRSGIHQYHFLEQGPQVVILDLDHRDEVLSAAIDVENDTMITGHRHSKAWAENQKLFFAIEFSKPIKRVETPDGDAIKNHKASFHFEEELGSVIEVKVGLSAVDIEGAKKNLEKEIGSKTFEQIRIEADEIWNNQLNKIQVDALDIDQKVNFYTAMYHSSLAPNLYQDIDGRYRGMDLNIHKTNDFEYYTVFSLWDTYRANHPLFTIIEEERTNDFIQTFLAKYQEGGIMPIWDLSGCYTGCMIGYHAVPVIADAYLKGINDYDTRLAYKAMKHSAAQDHLGLSYYRQFGFIPVEFESESVSKTLEYAYDDWTIAQMAKELGETDDYDYYIERAQSYKNVFDPESQFMRARFQNKWFGPFDPYEVNFNYTEANAWQYSTYVPQDVSGLIQLHGGSEDFGAHLDQIFTAEKDLAGRNQVDITGLIGQYAHGNEPSHHVAYLYNFIGQPHKTQKYVSQILNELYLNEPDGISGNEDCGQMSAWYIFSSLGFYPLTPASNEYIIGTPLFTNARIQLPNQKEFIISSTKKSKDEIYIAAASLNGEPLERSYIYHDEIMNGGHLHFVLSDTPTDWSTEQESWPVTSIENEITPPPFIKKGDLSFKDSTKVVLDHIDPDATIHYQWNESRFQTYHQPITINTEGSLHVKAIKNGQESKIITTQFHKKDPNIQLELLSKYENQYNAGGRLALIDKVFGTKDFRTGTWQGYNNENVRFILSVNDQRHVDSLSMQFLQDQNSWIFLPSEITCFGSNDGIHYEKIGTQQFSASEQNNEVLIKRVEFPIHHSYKRYKVVAKTVGELPNWHKGAAFDGKCWLFIDEVVLH